MPDTRRVTAHVTIFAMLCLAVSPGLRADIKYEESSRITGGLMEGLSKMAGFFGAKSLNNMTTTTYVKGDRMRTDHFSGGELTNSEVIQLDREQIIMIDHKKKSYSVMTFAERRAEIEKALNAMKGQANENPPKQPAVKDPEVRLESKVDVKEAGESKVVNGFTARRVILTVVIESEDQKTKDKAALGSTMDLWLTKDISGLEERNHFYQKYAAKLATPEMMRHAAAAPAMAQDPRMGEALQALSQKAKALEGEAVLTVTSFNISGTASSQGAPSRQASPPPQPSQRDSEAPESVGQAIGKALGGFGGFGRKKKKEEPRPQSVPAESSAAPGETATASLMTMTTELKSFSKAPLDAALFEVPPGYKLSKK